MSAEQDTLSAQTKSHIISVVSCGFGVAENVDAGQPVTFTISALQGDDWNSTDDFFLPRCRGSQFYQPVNSCYINISRSLRPSTLADDDGNFGAPSYAGFRLP